MKFSRVSSVFLIGYRNCYKDLKTLKFPEDSLLKTLNVRYPGDFQMVWKVSRWPGKLQVTLKSSRIYGFPSIRYVSYV